MRHIDMRNYFLHELKEQGIIKTKWRSGNKNSSDLFMKNLAGPTFEQHTKAYCVDKGRVLEYLNEKEKKRINKMLGENLPQES